MRKFWVECGKADVSQHNSDDLIEPFVEKWTKK